MEDIQKIQNLLNILVKEKGLRICAVLHKYTGKLFGFYIVSEITIPDESNVKHLAFKGIKIDSILNKYAHLQTSKDSWANAVLEEVEKKSYTEKINFLFSDNTFGHIIFGGVIY